MIEDTLDESLKKLRKSFGSLEKAVTFVAPIERENSSGLVEGESRRIERASKIEDEVD